MAVMACDSSSAAAPTASMLRAADSDACCAAPTWLVAVSAAPRISSALERTVEMAPVISPRVEETVLSSSLEMRVTSALRSRLEVSRATCASRSLSLPRASDWRMLSSAVTMRPISSLRLPKSIGVCSTPSAMPWMDASRRCSGFTARPVTSTMDGTMTRAMKMSPRTMKSKKAPSAVIVSARSRKRPMITAEPASPGFTAM